jgi:hypothetical protein
MRRKFKIQKFKFKSCIVNTILLFIFCFLLFNASAQSITITLDRDKILLGEQVTLQLSINNVNESVAFVAAWPQLADSINHTEIIKSTPVDTISINGSNTYQQKFVLTSFDSGRWQLGPFNFIMQDKFTGRQTQLSSEAVHLSVLPVNVSSMKDYHPIKDIIDVKASFDWKPVVITVIALALFAVILFIILTKRKKKPAAQKAVLKGTPLERALEKLYALQKISFTSIETIKNFHSETDDITRFYFEEMIHIKAMQLTGTEIFSCLKTYIKDEGLRRKFQQLFQLNASVKFAKYTPQADESKNMMNEIISSLRQIDEYINESRIHADRMVSKY